MSNKWMTEEQIENKVCRMVDSLDAHFMNSKMTQAEYDSEMKAINKWSENELRFARKMLD